MQRLHWSWHRISAAEIPLCIRCNRVSRHAPLRALFAAVSRLGDGVFWYALMGVLPLAYGSAAIDTVLRMFAAGLLGVALYKWLKRVTGRPRPYQVVPAVEAVAAPLDRFSFPSGHTLHAASFGTIACSQHPELAPLLIPFALLVAASRPILGLHYPSDVLAGALIGLMLGRAILAF
jgi:undecaprenyl-diphosphatase